MEKLKACPHCGGHAEIKDWTCGYESGTSVYCIQCGASVNAGVENGNGWHDRAIAAWNRRTAPENKPLTLEQLKCMNRRPVWVTGKRSLGTGVNGWMLISTKSSRPAALDFTGACNFADYGKTWLAYASELKGSEST